MQQMPGRDAYLDGLLALCNGSGRPRKSFATRKLSGPATAQLILSPLAQETSIPAPRLWPIRSYRAATYALACINHRAIERHC